MHYHLIQHIPFCRINSIAIKIIFEFFSPSRARRAAIYIV